MKKLLISIATAAAAVTMFASPVSAHVNEKAPVNETRVEQGAPNPLGAGFIGPIEDTDGDGSPGTIDSAQYVRAHSGMECGALRSPNILPLGPVSQGGIGFDNRFDCPSAP